MDKKIEELKEKIAVIDAYLKRITEDESFLGEDSYDVIDKLLTKRKRLQEALNKLLN